MEKETHSSARVVKIAACLLVATLAQTLLNNIGIPLRYIDWLLLVTVYFGLQRDPVQALLTGTAAGFLQDISSGAPFGISGIEKILAAYLAYWVSSKVYVEGLWVRLLTVAGASVLSTLTYLSFYRMLEIKPTLLEGRSTMAVVGWCLVANFIISLPLFAALDRLFKGGAFQRSRRAEAMRGMRRRRWRKVI